MFAVFFIFPSNFIDYESGVTIRKQLRITRLDTRRHRARDHSTRHRPLPTYCDPLEHSLYLQPFSR